MRPANADASSAPEPGTHDPDGHEVRFYTNDHHTQPPADGTPMVVDDPIGTEAERIQRAERQANPAAPENPS